MTRTAWIVIVAVVAAAAVAGTVGIVAMASDAHDPVAEGHGALLENRSEMNGPWGQQSQDSQMMPFGHGDGSGAGRQGRLAAWESDDGWSSVFGLPWLAAGLLIGLGATMLAWQPWKRPAVAMATSDAASSGEREA